MQKWVPTRWNKILLFGGICLLLQQVSITYWLRIGDDLEKASLVHLHTGMLLAIALLQRDRWVVVGSYALVAVGWVLRALALSYSGFDIAIGLLFSGVGCLWLLLVASWIARPGLADEQPLLRRHLPRFFLFGMLVFPLGNALIGAQPVGITVDDEALSAFIQMLFAKYFGVVVVALPLLVAWKERRRPPLAVRGRLAPRLLLLVAGVSLSIGLTHWTQHGLGTVARNGLVLADYRIVLLAAAAWCLLNLRLVHAMPLLSLVLWQMVASLGGTAVLGSTPLGFLNLLHLAMSVGIVLAGMMYFLVASRDREDLARQLSVQNRQDSLTGLPNLRALRAQVATRSGQGSLGYLLLDQADRLSVGYGVGAQTEVMNEVAARVGSARVQPYYLGSGQFALLSLEGETPAWGAVLHGIEREGFVVGQQALRLLPYLGVASFGGGTGLDLDAALMLASNRAFTARGNNEVEPQYVDTGSATLAQTQEQIQGSSQVLACLRRPQGVELYLQPIVDLRATPGRGSRAGGEVLCRLRDEQGRQLSPAWFLPAIEAVRRGPELDLAVVTALFECLRGNPGAADGCHRISLNLTGQSLASEGFRQRLLELLDAAPVPLSQLCFEITETVAVFSVEQSDRLLNELRHRGCSIAIDDFGVGMQSFARLKDMPVGILKIDGSFIRNVTREHRDFAMVQASVAVARACRAEVVAEYVEDAETAACLRKLGVHWAQGYWYARPMPLLEGLRWIRAWSGQADGDGDGDGKGPGEAATGQPPASANG